MLIDTRDFGPTEVDENMIIGFPDGVPGFEDDHRFALLTPLGESAAPCWLQSLDNSETCFIVFNPFELYPDYELDEAQLLDELGIGDETNVTVFTLAIVPEVYRDTTVNLRCPIVVNLDSMTAKQIILDYDYPIRAKAFANIIAGD
jgi:flagellar assembly factor FliW